ncbi:hypothetical protein [Paenibacillus sp. OAS669]|uniref:hypothetical protein n=1 Tax=Paenibacillus sp. OAS669 TaxID=2663821 RepID=UPI001789B5A5|nr:hypothetical protein [Paenibacillus sp. OAS669]MBE1442437.1 hypothetical protein [Paenibacillus sp. OAS669]
MKRWIGFMALTILVSGCSGAAESKTQAAASLIPQLVLEQPYYQELSAQPSLELEFSPLPSTEFQELREEKPPKEEVFLHTIEVQTSHEQSILVHLYAHKDDKNLIYGYLQDQDTWYSLGRLSGDGSSKVEPSQWRGGTVPEFEVNGSIGLSIFYYREDSRKWVKDNDFQMHEIYKLDLDGDHKAEIIETLWTQDPYVAVYRWNPGVKQFETAHIAPAANSFFAGGSEPQFAFPFQEDGQWYIQSGNGDVYSFFKYSSGSITPVILDDTRNRLKEQLRY